MATFTRTGISAAYSNTVSGSFTGDAAWQGTYKGTGPKKGRLSFSKITSINGTSVDDLIIKGVAFKSVHFAAAGAGSGSTKTIDWYSTNPTSTSPSNKIGSTSVSDAYSKTISTVTIPVSSSNMSKIKSALKSGAFYIFKNETSSSSWTTNYLEIDSVGSLVITYEDYTLKTIDANVTRKYNKTTENSTDTINMNFSFSGPKLLSSASYSVLQGLREISTGSLDNFTTADEYTAMSVLTQDVSIDVSNISKDDTKNNTTYTITLSGTIQGGTTQEGTNLSSTYTVVARKLDIDPDVPLHLSEYGHAVAIGQMSTSTAMTDKKFEVKYPTYFYGNVYGANIWSTVEDVEIGKFIDADGTHIVKRKTIVKTTATSVAANSTTNVGSIGNTIKAKPILNLNVIGYTGSEVYAGTRIWSTSNLYSSYVNSSGNVMLRALDTALNFARVVIVCDYVDD